MKFSIAWLSEWVDIPISITDLVAQFTQIGLEVESVEDDRVIELAIPPNRGDCLSIMGIARELSVLNCVPIKQSSIGKIPPTIKDHFTIQVQAPKECPKYLGRVFKNINANAQTPDWMKESLEAAGINSISAVVDITNYVMLELGQPLHAFSLQAIEQGIIVRKANPQEKLILLDQTEITLQPDNLVIADQHKPLALAGVIGGLHSGVMQDTKDILLECAYFDHISIRLTARQHGLNTESSHRFERIVDATLQERAVERATSLLQDITSAQAGPVITVIEPKYLPPPIKITLRKSRIKKILNILPSDEQINDILTRLGMECQYHDLAWDVKVPTYRADLALEMDLIEEIARFIGYDQIPTIIPEAELHFKQRPEEQISELQVKSCLQCRGYNEVVTYSFISPELAKLFEPEQEHLQLINPISTDMSVMRPSLWPGLVQVFQYNQHRQCDRSRIFEIGLKFVVDKQHLQQEQVLSGLCVGKILPEHWDVKSKNHDFFDIKGDVEALGKLAVIDGFTYQPIQLSSLHPGRSAAIFKGKQRIGYVGELHPKLAKDLNILVPLLVFELNLAALTYGNLCKFCYISKYPGIRRDLAIIVDQKVAFYDIEKEVKIIAGNLLRDLCMFDVYCSQVIGNGKQSIGLGIILQHPSRTMVDDEIKQIMENIIAGLKLKFNATLR